MDSGIILIGHLVNADVNLLRFGILKERIQQLQK